MALSHDSGGGLLHGICLLTLSSLLLGVVANLPLWLVLRSESGEEMCWRGDGVWQTSAWFGSQPSVLGPCDQGDTMSTLEAYCGTDADTTTFQSGMCHAVRLARPALVLTMITLCLLAVLMFWLPRRWRFLEWLVRWAGLPLVLASIGLPAYAFYVMQFISPLFSSGHRMELSKAHAAGIPFDQFSGCSLSSPLHSLKSLVVPSTLQCLFPGPAYFATLMICFLQLVALAFLLLFVWWTKQQQRHSFASWSCMYSTIVRRVTSRRGNDGGNFFLTNFLTAVLPFVCIVSHILVWFGFVFYGVQIINTVEFVTASSSSSPSVVLFKNTLNGFNFSPELSLSYFWNNGARAIAALCFFAMLIAPAGKSLLWILFFYAPSPPKLRGAVLTFLDLTGKVQLVYLFVLALQAVCSSIDSHVPLLPHLLEMHFVIGFTWHGIGARLLLGSVVWSLVLGQAFLWLHEACLQWERQEKKELRAANDAAAVAATAAAVIDDDDVCRNDRTPVCHHVFKLRACGCGGACCCCCPGDGDDRNDDDNGLRYLQWTLRGRRLVLLMTLIVAAAFAAVQFAVLFTVKQTDALTLVIPKQQRTKHVSLLSLQQLVMGTGMEGKQPLAVVSLLFITLTAMPLVRVALACACWFTPLTRRAQAWAFDVLELTAAWSSVEVFLITVVVCSSELAPLTERFSGEMTPKLNELVKLVLPMFHGMLGTEMHIHWPAVGLCLAAVMLEKLLAAFFMSQLAVCVKERNEHRRCQQPRRPTPHGWYGGLPRLAWTGLLVQGGWMEEVNETAAAAPTYLSSLLG